MDDLEDLFDLREDAERREMHGYLKNSITLL